MAGNTDNLKPFDADDPESVEKARELGRIGGIKSGESKREKKLMTAIYADFLAKEHDIVGSDGIKKKISGDKLLSSVMSKVLSRGDSASVSLMREIRETLEGSKIALEHSATDDMIETFINNLKSQ